MNTEEIAISYSCEKLVKQFAKFNDLGQLDCLVALFVEDGSFARPLDPDNPIVGRENILAMMKARPPRLSRHFMTNIVIDILSPDEAEGLSYVTFLSTTDVDAPRPAPCEPKMFMGEYRDSFVRTADGWRFKSRQGNMTLVLNV